MLLAIDPDVLTISAGEPNSKQTKEANRLLEWVAGRLSDIHIAIDKPKKALLREYVDFYQQHIDDESPALLLVESIINNEAVQTRQLQTHLPHDLEVMIEKYKCTKPVEPTLIAMGHNAGKLAGLTIILPSQPGVRSRGLYQTHIKQAFEKQISKLTIAYSSQAQISFPPVEDKKQKTERGYWFEDKVRSALHQILKCPHVDIKTPDVLMNAKGVGEIDFYGYELKTNPRTVWIGECKLREFRSSDPITIKELEQLEKKLDAVKAYEESRPNINSSTSIQCVIVSNADSISENARQKDEEMNITFYRAVLSKNWKFVSNWNIDALDILTYVNGKQELVKRVEIC